MNEDVQVKEALDLLKICRNTLYMWELKGKISSKRDPKSNYRFYNRKDIDKLRPPIDQEEK